MLGTNNAITNYTAAVANPQSRLDVSPRFDFQFGSKNTLSVRYMYNRQTDSFDGINGLALQTQGYDVRNNEHSLQISDTQVLVLRFVNKTRFQFIASRDEQAAISTAPR